MADDIPRVNNRLEREIKIHFERDERPLIQRGGNNRIFDDDIELNDEIEDERSNARYLEPVHRFPMPSNDPMLRTAQGKQRLTNIRTNPHYKLTQV